MSVALRGVVGALMPTATYVQHLPRLVQGTRPAGARLGIMASGMGVLHSAGRRWML